jgi:branched-chain amino acid aminotransferase
MLKITLPYSLPILRRLLYQSLSINHLKNALVRIMISRGTGPIGLDPALCRKPTVVIIPRSFHGCSEAQGRIGLKVAIASVRRTPPQALNPRIKSMNFLNNILAKIQAKENHADEGLMLSLDGYLTEGSASNLFLIKRRRLYTPAAGLHILEGITRQVVIELAKENRIPRHETRLRPSDLYKADECFLTSTSMEVMPVVRADGRRIGNGTPGPITRRLHRAYLEKVRSECGF